MEGVTLKRGRRVRLAKEERTHQWSIARTAVELTGGMEVVYSALTNDLILRGIGENDEPGRRGKPSRRGGRCYF